MRNAKRVLGWVATALAVGTIPLLAQAASPAAAPAPAAPAAARPGLTSSAPVDITADELEVQNEKRLSIFRGSVEALQGANRLRTPQLTVYYAPKAAAGAAPAPAGGTGGLGAIERMEATGPVYFVTPTQTAKGDSGVYTAANETIVLTGNVVLVQDRNVVRGDQLNINQVTGQSTLISNAKGRGTKERVRGVFYPSQTPAAGGTAPASAPAAGAR